MIIKKIIIIDSNYQEANTFEFSPKANVITAQKNTQGKSCLLKSIYFALGLDIKTFKEDWQPTKKMFKIFYEHNDKKGTIIRYRDRIWLDNNPNSIDLKEYSKWLSSLLNLKIKLPLKNTDEYDEVYPSAYILPFYVDQDNSWSGAIYKNVVNELGAYNSTYIPKSMFEYIFKISNEEIMQLEEEHNQLNNEKGSLIIRKKSIQELKDKFISDAEPIVFDEEEAKEYIKKYLYYSQRISEKIQIKKNTIYDLEIKLDRLKLELMEIEEIINCIDTEYDEIKTRCKYCHSELTINQSIQRLKLSNNKYDLGLKKEQLKRNIAKVEEKITNLLNEKAGLEEDYLSLLQIAEIRQKEYSLNEYIENKAKSMTKDNYYKIEDKLSLDIAHLEDDIKNIQKIINEKKKAQKSLQERIANSFEELKTTLNAKFPNVNMTLHSFMEFRGIKNSGATKNAEYFMLYIIYLKLLIEYAIIKVPIGLDSVIKDEVDENNKKNFYKIIEKYVLQSDEQSFVVMLDDKISTLENPKDYNYINLEKPILKKEEYDKLIQEFKVIYQI